MNKYGISIKPICIDNKITYFAECIEIPDCVAQGNTYEEAANELIGNIEMWLETAKEFGIKIPEPNNTVSKKSGKLSLRISKRSHEEASKIAKEEGISINQFIQECILEKIGEYNGVNKTISRIESKINTFIPKLFTSLNSRFEDETYRWSKYKEENIMFRKN